jgi:uncharacterized BrkB/YihY/UPF0761 family membrane protein
MAPNQPSKDVEEKAEELRVHLFGIVLKTLFLIGFLVLNFVAQPWIERFQPDGLLEQIEFWAMRVLFAVFTVVPLLMMVYRDLRILWIRNQKKIEVEKNRR